MMNIGRLFLISIPVLLFSCKPLNKINLENEKNLVLHNDNLIKNLQSAYEKNAIMGFSVAVVNEKGLVYEKGFGFSDLEQKKDYTPNSIQNIGSISKTLIGIALLKAQELGKLNINDPVNKYLPFKIFNPNHPEIPILIKHLAYHTSTIVDLDEVYGRSYVLTKKEIPENEEVLDYFQKSEDHITVSKFLENALTQNGKWFSKNTFSGEKPGEKYEYSNIGAALCALVIESATGQDYRDFTKENILKPLKMNHSGWSSKDINGKKRSRLFINKEKMIADYSLITYADGGFLTSTNDLGLYLTELIRGFEGNGTLLKNESYRKLFEKKKFLENEKTKEFGIFMEFREGFLGVQEDLIGHNGSDPGVFTAMYFNPKTKIGKIVFVNTDTDYSDKIWPEIKEIWKSTSEF